MWGQNCRSFRPPLNILCTQSGVKNIRTFSFKERREKSSPIFTNSYQNFAPVNCHFYFPDLRAASFLLIVVFLLHHVFGDVLAYPWSTKNHMQHGKGLNYPFKILSICFRVALSRANMIPPCLSNELMIHTLYSLELYWVNI